MLSGSDANGEEEENMEVEGEATEVPAQEDEKPSTLLTVCPFILGNEFCERLAFYGLSTNLVVYLNRQMGMDTLDAASQVNLWAGTCYMTPLIGAYLADGVIGRYKTIVLFSCAYCIGMFCLALSAAVPELHPAPDKYPNFMQNAVLFGSLYLIALGTGGIKPNVSAFGAEQFDENNERDVKEKKSFFNWFYFVINCGSLIASLLIVWIQETISWSIGFAIPAAAMLLAVVSFVSGRKRYTHMKPKESPLSRFTGVLMDAWRNKRTRRRLRGGETTTPLIPHNISYAWIEDAAAERGGKYSEAQVEEVRLVVRMFPIFVTTIFYWIIYQQMGSVFVEQGELMDRTLVGDFVIPAASLSSFDTISIIILVPLFDRVIYPMLKRLGFRPTLLQRIGWGNFIAVLSMLAAAGVEVWRLHLADEKQFIDGSASRSGEIVNMSVFWQAPQYLLVGMSEVLGSIGQMEFFYDQAPDSMRSLCMAMQLLSTALGGYLSSAILFAVQWATQKHPWIPRNLNKGRLDLYFLFLAGLMMVNVILFMFVAMGYEYKKVPHRRRSGAARDAEDEEPEEPVTATRHFERTQPIAAPGFYAQPSYARSITMMADSPLIPARFR